MRRVFILFMTAILFNVTASSAQKFPILDVSPMDIALFRPGGNSTKPIVKVIYSRPQKKGRTMLGGIEKYGKVWRTGANENTEIKLYRDITFVDKEIKAGTYSLFSIPGEKEWTIIFNYDLDVWGAFSYDQSKDVARIKVVPMNSEEELENFSILFEGNKSSGTMFLGWGNTIVKIPFKF